MKAIRFLVVVAAAACAPTPAPTVMPSPAPTAVPMAPYDGPFESSSPEAHRIYETVLQHFDTVVIAPDEARSGARSVRAKLDPRIARLDPTTFRATNATPERHDPEWLKSLEGRFHVVGHCEPSGAASFCDDGLTVLLAPIRRPDRGAAEVELFAYSNSGGRRVFSTRLYTLWLEPDGWRVTGSQIRLIS